MPFCDYPSNDGVDSGRNLELLARNTETRAKLREGILGYQPNLGRYQPNFSTYQPNFRFFSQTTANNYSPLTPTNSKQKRLSHAVDLHPKDVLLLQYFDFI
ncbi:hypothetical protein SFC57_09885 [Niallia circulans]|uniref:hypothetical protein n=1 Tax=Niallia circulans TaxID=1397 RepID=UPI00397B8123